MKTDYSKQNFCWNISKREAYLWSSSGLFEFINCFNLQTSSRHMSAVRQRAQLLRVWILPKTQTFADSDRLNLYLNLTNGQNFLEEASRKKSFFKSVVSDPQRFWDLLEFFQNVQFETHKDQMQANLASGRQFWTRQTKSRPTAYNFWGHSRF